MLDFEAIKKYEPITVVGHVNADFDSTVSCILMSKYLDFHNIKNKVKMLNNHIDENLQYVDIDGSKFEVGITDSENLFVVDSSFKFENNIVGCIDHHPETPNTSINYISKKSTSCAKIIHDLMEEEGYVFSKEDLKLVCLSLFTDSCSFKSSKALPSDHEWVKKIIDENGFDYDDFFDKGLCLNALSDESKSYCFYGTKKYNREGFDFYSSYIQVKENTSEEFDMECIKTIQERMNREDISFWVFVINNVYKDNTKYILIKRDSYIIHYKVFTEEDKQLISRGTDVLPRAFAEIKNTASLFFAGNNYESLVKTLIDRNISISTMESCTSGLIASSITNTEGASAILKGAFVTYSNEAKVLQGVPKEIIDEFGVYSYETAYHMATACSNAYNSKIGIGITGTTGNVDESNADSVKGEIYFCVKIDNSNYLTKINMDTANLSRKAIKEMIVDHCLAYLKVLIDYPY